jgi:hypothetical protein
LTKIIKKIEADPQAKFYMDEALTAVAEDEAEHMELYTQNEAARVAVERERRVAAKKENGHAKAPAAAGRNGNGHEANGHDAPRPDAGHQPHEPSEPVSPLV